MSNVNKVVRSLSNNTPSNKVSFNTVDEVVDITPEVDYTEINRKKKEERENYNKGVTVLDERYTSLKPYQGKVIVRVFVEDFDDSLIATNINNTISAPTKSGVGTQEVENKYDIFSRKAIVVSSSNMAFPEGTVVQLSEMVVTPRAVQQGGTTFLFLEHAFTHYSYTSKEPPTNLSDKDFGYFLIPPQLIDATIG